MKADVLLVKPEFMLMCGRAHASGRLIYVPVKQVCFDETSFFKLLLSRCILFMR